MHCGQNVELLNVKLAVIELCGELALEEALDLS